MPATIPFPNPRIQPPSSRFAFSLGHKERRAKVATLGTHIAFTTLMLSNKPHPFRLQATQKLALPAPKRYNASDTTRTQATEKESTHHNQGT